MTMESWQERASILVEALPYIQIFRGKIALIKYGGSAMDDENLKRGLMRDIALLKCVGLKPLIVHGGGKEINKWLDKSGLETRFHRGLRVTTPETMEVVEMVLNRINKELVGLLGEFGVNACGLSGRDGGLLRVRPRDIENLGLVGAIVSVDATILNYLIDCDYVPIICPIGSLLDGGGQAYNINADEVAFSLAQAMRVEKLVFLSDVDGLYEDYDTKSGLISELTASEARRLMERGAVGGGMIPKLENSIRALEGGVSRVHIINGRIEHCLLLEFFTKAGIGTAILA